MRAVILALLAGAASAQDFSASRMTLLPGDGACFARVEIENRFGVYNRTETIETPRGPVQIDYTTVGGHQPGDDDLIEVVGLPPGVTAHPFSAPIVDGEKLIVCLMEYVGA